MAPKQWDNFYLMVVLLHSSPNQGATIYCLIQYHFYQQEPSWSHNVDLGVESWPYIFEGPQPNGLTWQAVRVMV